MNYLIDGKLTLPIKLLLENSVWFLEGIHDRKKIKINLSTVNSFDGNFVDEVVVIRPLTNRIYVDPKTMNVLKIYVDQRDQVVSMELEKRDETKQQIKLNEIPSYQTVNDAFVNRRRRRR